MAKWKTIGHRAFNLDAVVCVDRGRGDNIDILFASPSGNGNPIYLSKEEKAAILGALQEQGMVLPEETADGKTWEFK
jgi:hypothetical protein